MKTELVAHSKSRVSDVGSERPNTTGNKTWSKGRPLSTAHRSLGSSILCPESLMIEWSTEIGQCHFALHRYRHARQMAAFFRVHFCFSLVCPSPFCDQGKCISFAFLILAGTYFTLTKKNAVFISYHQLKILISRKTFFSWYLENSCRRCTYFCFISIMVPTLKT